MNISLYAVTAIEADRYLYFLQNRGKMTKVFDFYQEGRDKIVRLKLMHQNLTQREIEIALLILNNLTYKQIGQNFLLQNIQCLNMYETFLRKPV